ncbi:hypothetical protein [Beijerinckia sp. L45]|uniref:hypothetical protein n=1 Tax=Beijerinckia sp. L45 TaxID=1641855 RepID=UPI00131C61CF|nr:hypothetical protein [Beijerinckia sp. L45]
MIVARRTFLGRLATLPLIGGSVALIGNPTAVAEAVTLPLLDLYADWLAVEYGECLIERSGFKQPEHAADAMCWRREWCRDNLTLNPRGDRFLAAPSTPASSRAAVVLSAVDYEWREGRS